MGSKNVFYVLFFCAIALFPALCLSQDYDPSRATYYGTPDCLVSGVSRLYRGGAGCGACHQVRCTIPAHCMEEGAKVVVTDYGEGDRTDFVLSTAAYARLPRPNKAEVLFAYGVVDVEFKRIPCQYYKYNFDLLKVHQHSRHPGYLASIPLYQPGVYDITTAVEVWQEDCKEWRPMRRAYGTTFDITDPPLEAITLRYQASVYGSKSWVQLNNVISSDWQAGYYYDSGISV